MANNGALRLCGSAPPAYEAVTRPWLWLATRRSDYRIFQGKSVPEIVQEVLAPYGFGIINKLVGDYRQWDYCVQYGETDFNFISRLLEHEGAYYYFEHQLGSHKLVPATCRALDGRAANPSVRAIFPPILNP